MATANPIGWSSSLLSMHYKTVIPTKEESGMYYNIHRNIRPQFLPKTVGLTQKMDTTRRVLSRQRKLHDADRIPRYKIDRIIAEASNESAPASVPRPRATVPYLINQQRKLYFPLVGKKTRIAPYAHYDIGDVKKIVQRLSTNNLARVPESKGYGGRSPPMTAPGKLYKSEDIDKICQRLSEYDPRYHPPESRGFPAISKSASLTRSRVESD